MGERCWRGSQEVERSRKAVNKNWGYVCVDQKEEMQRGG